jgi:hypothetical protein
MAVRRRRLWSTEAMGRSRSGHAFCPGRAAAGNKANVRKNRRPGRSYAPNQAAKTTLFAAGNEANVRKNRRSGRSYAPNQAAKTTLFAAGNEANVRKNRRRRFFPIK